MKTEKSSEGEQVKVTLISLLGEKIKNEKSEM